ncbi:hypothetical protein ACTFIR_012838 [Dictyostelium discoideum]
MPFGLSTASRIFTMLLRPVFRMLRDINVSVIAYLDDLLIVGSTKEECRLNEEVININVGSRDSKTYDRNRSRPQMNNQRNSNNTFKKRTNGKSHIYRDCKVTPVRFQSVNAVFSDSVPIQSTNSERKVTIETAINLTSVRILADSGADINIIPKAALTMEQLKSRKESNVMLWKTNSVTWFNSFGTPVIKSIPVG